MTYLLTSHGTLVCRHTSRGELVHRPLMDPGTDVEMLDIGVPVQHLRTGLGHFLRDDAAALNILLDDGPLTGWTLRRGPDRRALIAIRDGLLLTARSEAEALATTDGPVTLDSMFLTIDATDLDVLRGILAARWLVRSAGEAMRPERPVLAHGFGLRIGTMEVELRWNLPFSLGEWPNRLTLLRDAWRIEQIYRYRPLVYFVAFGNSIVMRQFALNVESLLTVGAYDGEIMVVTDKTPREIDALLPRNHKASVVLLPTEAHDRTGYMSARFCIVRWPGAWDYQPLLYVDADILFDEPVAPMLYGIALADRIGAAREPYLLAESPFVGGDLLRDDGCLPGPDEYGFNSGTLGIPNMRQHTPSLGLIARVLHNRLAQFGRDESQFVDQPVANYVSYRIANVDTELLSRYVRLSDALADPAGRTGLVHYCWVPDGGVRVALMERYLERLRAIR